ncbi:MAG: D-alanyl-lipoteichoic acid biosynthesis protein DltD [Lachnospiraceae bacterium]|nr:D-alanyl-lipoteichoic acid biosynthesis protein DltD [Lachnospiraceae bacterium]
MKAFLLALLLFAVTVTGCHFYIGSRESLNNPVFSTWSAEDKAKNREGLMANMNEGSIPVFGSSEFQHGTDTPYHPASVFAGNRFNPMLIGAGYYQSLSHAITLAAIEPSLVNRKAVLFISPQWFRRPGVVDQAFSSRFSETLYYGMLENEKLSEETRDYIRERAHKLLSVDSKTKERVIRHEKNVLEAQGNPAERLFDSLWDRFLEEKDRFMMTVLEISNGIGEGNGIREEDTEPDWDALMQQAETDGEQDNQNQFYINSDKYKQLEPYLPAKKDMNKDAVNGYQKSPEYDDLRCFLEVCRELEIEPMLVIVPVNGYYYDYTGFPKKAREKYYDNVRAVAAEYGAKVADFADQEYTKYFFEDRVHLGRKGWVMVNESLYQFYKKG